MTLVISVAHSSAERLRVTLHFIVRVVMRNSSANDARDSSALMIGDTSVLVKNVSDRRNGQWFPFTIAHPFTPLLGPWRYVVGALLLVLAQRITQVTWSGGTVVFGQ